MKASILLFIAASLFLTSQISSQVCTGDFSFNNQQALDDFLLNNPTCTSIDGNLTVENAIGLSDPILDLSALENIQTITGNFYIYMEVSPNSLSGLNALTTVGGEFFLFDNSNWQGSPVFTDYSGLENLSSVGKLSLYIGSQVDLTPFDNLTSANYIEINFFGASQFSVIDIFPGITSLSEGLRINSFNPPVIDFSGFHNLSTAGSIFMAGDFSGGGWIYFNDFNAFDQLISCDQVYLSQILINNFISGFQNLQSVTNEFWFDVGIDGGMYAEFDSLESATNVFVGMGGVNIPVSVVFDSLTDVGIVQVMGMFESVSFPVLQQVDELHLYLSEYEIPSTRTVSAPSLISVSGTFEVDGVEDSDLSGFPSLAVLGGDVWITNCTNLSDCTISALCDKLSVDPTGVHLENNAPGCNTGAEVISDCTVSFVAGTVFADMNCDGVQDAGDFVVPNAIIHNQDNIPVGDSFANGSYFAVLPDNSTTSIQVMIPPGFLAGTAYTLTTTTADDVFSDFDFPLCPDLNYHDVGQYVFGNWPRPGFYSNYSIYATNFSPNSEDITITADLSTMPGATINSTSGTVNGNIITWIITGLGFMETSQVSFQIYVSPSTPLGTPYHLYTQVTINGGATDADLSNNSGTLNQTVVGSYDPNDKTVDRPAIDIASMTSTECVWLDYTIRFQNTGTAEAINVRVQDVMEEDLDLSTFQQLNASHPFTLSFDENRRVEWLFENIMLPDCFSNEEASHGFIHFRIKTNPGLGLNDIVENSAAIYFDYNEPVITNTATTIFYECTQNAEIIGVADVCEGNDVSLSSSGNWSDYTWTVNGNVVGAENQLILSDLIAGAHSISLHVADTYCMDDATYLVNVMAIPATPVITQSGNTLTATGGGIFTWTLDGNELADIDNTIEITESGVYGVSVMESICVSDVVTGSFEFVSIVESNGEYVFICYPNPVNEVLFIDLPVTWSGPNQIVISDQLGKVMIKSNSANNHISLCMNSLASGVYQIMVCNESEGSILTSQIFVE